jgi:hypothetical protein
MQTNKFLSMSAAIAAFSFTMTGVAHAGGTIKFGDDQSVTVGFGARTSFTAVEDAAPSGKDWSKDFNLDSARLYVSGSVNKWIKGTLNTELDSNDDLHILDAYAQFEFSDEFNIWAGRMLPPSDRSNLDGPYYLSSWAYPGVVSQYPAKFAGRTDGVTVWGKLMGKKLTYAAGVYDGIDSAANQSDNLLYAGRVAYNFLDVEDNPAYYTSSTYYGGADVLTLAVDFQYQSDGVGTALKPGNYFGYSVDALFEKKVMDGGAVTFEGAYYKYDTDDILDPGGLSQGKAYLASAAFLFPTEVGAGKFQPVVRYQKFENELTSIDTKRTDFGVNYIIKGHSARISAAYGINEASVGKDYNDFTLGLQVQY